MTFNDEATRAGVNRRLFMGAVAGTVGAAGVAGSLAFPAAAQAAATDDDYSEVAPNEVSFVPITRKQVMKAVGQLDGLAKQMLKRTCVPGLAFGVVYQGEVVFAKAYGVRKVGHPEKITTQTVFQIASLSKAVASTVVAGVVDDHGLQWDDPIVKYLPDFSLGDPYVTKHVTLADLFSHRSGLPDHAGDIMEDMGFSRSQILAKLGLFPMGPFRAKWDYTNFGLTAAGLAAAASRGTDWETLSHRVLYGPLGMRHTSGTYAQLLREKNRAALHVRVNGKWVAKYQRNAEAQSPAGGVNSSLEDMLKWLKLQLAGGKAPNGQQVIPAKALLETHLPHFTNNPANTFTGRSSHYALGYNTSVDAAGRMRLSHSGAFGLGAGTAFEMVPSAGLGIIGLTNGVPLGVPESLNATFFDLVEHGTSTRDWLGAYLPRLEQLGVNPSRLAGKKPPKHPVPAKANSAYAGIYTNAIYGKAVISVGTKGLVLAVGPKQRFALTHWDGDVFAYYPVGENALGISAVTFTPGAGGRAGSVNVEFANGNPLISPTLGTFTRV